MQINEFIEMFLAQLEQSFSIDEETRLQYSLDHTNGVDFDLALIVTKTKGELIDNYEILIADEHTDKNDSKTSSPQIISRAKFKVIPRIINPDDDIDVKADIPPISRPQKEY